MAKRPEWLRLLILCLSVWRLSRMMTEEDGPGDVFRKIRESSGAEHNGIAVPWDELNSWGKLAQCPYCLSPWLAMFLLILSVLNITLYELVTLSLCSSAATVLIEEAKQL